MRVALLLIFIVQLFAITNVGGVIIENTVWGPTGNPPDSVYNLISQVEVVDSVSLTIQPGTRIQSVTHGIHMYGSLFACGTSQEKVTFTSANVSPNPGDWEGLWFMNSYNDTNLILNCLIEYAVEGIQGNATLKVEDSRISSCSSSGIYIGNSIEIINCEITDNIISGIVWSGYSDSIPLYLSNNIINNNNIGLVVYQCTQMPNFASPNTFLNNDSSIMIWGGPEIHVTDTLSWNPALGGIDTWLIFCNIVIDSNGIFDIAPGNSFRFDNSSYLVVNGRLIANGTQSDSIIFTSASVSPAIGDWHGIHQYTECPDTCYLSYCIIEYADEICVSPIKIEHSALRYLQYGVWCSGLISNCEIHNNLTGIHFGWNILHINNNNIRDNDWGIYIEPYSPSGTGLPYFDIPNQFRNNTRDIYISIMGVHIIDDYYWNPSIDSVHCFIDCQFEVDTTGTFRIAPGNHFHLSEIMAYGTIIAEGEDSKLISFSGIPGNPVPGDWWGITLCGPSTNSRFKHCSIKYADRGIDAPVGFSIDSSVVDTCNVGILLRNGSITNCDIIGNTAGGIWCGLSDSLNIVGCVISGNQTGIGCYVGASPNIYNNQIYGNTEWGVFNMENNYWIMAEHNWWGDSTGPCDTSMIDTLYNPGGLGDRVSDHVDYDPWLYWPGIEEQEYLKPIEAVDLFDLQISNPFIHKAIFSYRLPQASKVELRIFNALGQLIFFINEGNKQEGVYVVVWKGNDIEGKQVPAGIYFCILSTNDHTVTKKIIKIR